MPRPNRQTALVWLAVGALAIFSLGLSLMRIYQVDEAQNLYMARVAWRGEWREFFTSGALYLYPLGWLSAHASTSAGVFTAARLLFLGVFWLNAVLLTIATGARLASAHGAWVMLGAATLAPMWDYGIEVRHENLILTGVLVMWWLGRSEARRLPLRLAIAGALAAILQFVAFKAMLYTVPASFLLLALPRANVSSASRLRLVASWVAGVLAGIAIARLAYAMLGAWEVYTAGAQQAVNKSAEVTRSLPWTWSAARLLTQTPLLLAGGLAALIVAAGDVRANLANGDAFAGALPEALLCLAALGALIINPTPFPYNLLLLVPFAYLLAVRALFTQSRLLAPDPALWPWVLGVVVFAHGVPFAVAVKRHLAFDNARQVLLMDTAEALTDAQTDRVYDATGLVNTRRSVHRWWFMHSLISSAYGTPEMPRLPNMLRAHTPVVFIPSYRTDWLAPQDTEFVTANYIPLADDFWVLGGLIEGERSWDCLHAGRYELELIGEPGMPPPTLIADGSRMNAGVHRLRRTRYAMKLSGSGKAALVWIGPRLDRSPALPQFDHKQLFVNWY